VLIVLFL